MHSEESTVKKIYGLSNVYETTNHIVGQLTYEKQFVYFIYNKNSQKTLCYKSFADTEPWQILPLDFSTSDENCFYKTVSSDDISLIRMIFGTGKKPIEKNSLNYEIIYNTEDCDNPVVAQFFLKR